MYVKASCARVAHLAGMDTQKLAPRFAVASAILFVTLVVMQIVP
jgi:hypothetical protein